MIYFYKVIQELDSLILYSQALLGVPSSPSIDVSTPNSVPSAIVGQSNNASAQMTLGSITPALNSSKVSMSPMPTGIVVESKGQIKVSLELDHDLVLVKTLKLPGNYV